MQRSIPLLLLCLSTVFTASAEKDYPLHVQLLESTWTNIGYGMAHGYGRGNIIDGESTRGFDFTYNCSSTYNTTTGNGAYLGRWKKEELRLIVQGQQIGGQRRSECEMKTTLQRDIYIQKNGQLFLISQEQFKNAKENLRPADKDATHYPVKISILSADWQSANLGSVGSGKGNIIDGDNVEGFNFASTCAVTFQAGPGVYAAKWKEEKSKLTLLAKAIGENQFYTCDLKLDLIAGAYLKNNNTGVVNQVTHDQFNALLANRRQAPTPKRRRKLLPPGGSGASSAAKTNVNVLSDPNGADIEIDGKLSAAHRPSSNGPRRPRRQHPQVRLSRVETNYDYVRGEVKVNANLERRRNAIDGGEERCTVVVHLSSVPLFA